MFEVSKWVMWAHFRLLSSKSFSLCKELLNQMCFDPCNHSMKIWKSIEIPTPKVGAHLGVWRFILSHSPTLLGAWNVIPGLHTWPTPSQALALIASPRLRLQHFDSYLLQVFGCLLGLGSFDSLKGPLACKQASLPITFGDVKFISTSIIAPTTYLSS